ncbi:MAG TPA: antibiotic biosynthesis monooxygenase [Anaerolineales bacterium]|nr:antibiotic biosynthesis monooxygenase [Anaerolineales bacterium]
MHVIIWEYQVKADRITEFEGMYASKGKWAQLFKKHPDYLGTELLRAPNHPQRYVTIDRWASSEAYNSFQAMWQAEYKELDAICENLTDRESLLGTSSFIQPGGAMIVRMWHGRVPTSKADAYREFTNARAIPDYQSVKGNISVHVLERRAGDITHFITLTFWESLEAIKGFAGEDVEAAKYYPEDKDFLLEFEPTVVHYEVVGHS